MAIRITKRIKYKGSYWLRDNYGGWTNEYGVRFTKNEHRNFGYRIREANKKIREYLKKYPQNRVSKSSSVGDRFRKNDLARFRRKSAYKNYLAVTERVISGEQLYIKMPSVYQDNLIKALSSPELIRLTNKLGLSDNVEALKDKLKLLTAKEIIKLSRDAKTPDINAYYVVIGDIQKSNIQRLEGLVDEMIKKRDKKENSLVDEMIKRKRK